RPCLSRRRSVAGVRSGVSGSDRQGQRRRGKPPGAPRGGGGGPRPPPRRGGREAPAPPAPPGGEAGPPRSGPRGGGAWGGAPGRSATAWVPHEAGIDVRSVGRSQRIWAAGSTAGARVERDLFANVFRLRGRSTASSRI